MEGVRLFLESSTIHGLTYISTTRKYVRLFWFLVVVTGFSGAVYLIRESFASWSESPIKTTIETLPISEIKFPKVTVCPPKNTLTDLNYDLMMTENKKMTKEMKDDLFKYALEVLNIEKSFYQSNFTKLHEEHRFYNWYHGYTKMILPEWIPESDEMDQFGNNPYNFGGEDIDTPKGLLIDHFTSATSGVVTSQYYGNKFQRSLVERKLFYSVKVYPPQSIIDNDNVTLHFNVEKISIPGLSRPSKEIFSLDFYPVDGEDMDTINKNFTPPGRYRRQISLFRDVTNKDVEQMQLELMPGFKLRWWYTGGDVIPDPEFEFVELMSNKHFVRLGKPSKKLVSKSSFVCLEHSIIIRSSSI